MHHLCLRHLIKYAPLGATLKRRKQSNALEHTLRYAISLIRLQFSKDDALPARTEGTTLACSHPGPLVWSLLPSALIQTLANEGK